MKRVLHVVGTMDYGGVETLLMTIYRKIDRQNIQFDFLCHNRSTGKYTDEIAELGGRVFSVEGPSHLGLVRYHKQLVSYFRTHPEYHIIHAHKSGLNGLILYPAKITGIRNRISHSHIAGASFGFPKNAIVSYSMLLNQISATDRFACSIEAGKYLFHNASFEVIPNAIDVEKFVFDSEKRGAIRQELHADDDTVVIGHVGRFTEQKNHDQIICIFSEDHSINPHSILVLLGDGETREEIEDKVQKMHLSPFVRFEGLHANVNEYYSAMDCFLFPSLYEGLGIVAVEAQCSGLPVLASDRVPSEVQVTEDIHFLSLSDSPAQWAAKMHEIIRSHSLTARTKAEDLFRSSRYNIDTVANRLEMYYNSLL